VGVLDASLLTGQVGENLRGGLLAGVVTDVVHAEHVVDGDGGG